MLAPSKSQDFHGRLEFQVNRQPLLLHINGVCMEALQKAAYRVRFRVRHEKMKVTSSPDLDLEAVDVAKELLEEMKSDSPTGTDKLKQIILIVVQIYL